MSLAPDLPLPTGQLRQFKTLSDLLTAAEPRLKRRFLALVGDARTVSTLEEIATLVELGQLEEAMALMDQVGPGMHNAITQTYAKAGLNAAAFIRATTGAPVEFNLLGERAVESLRLSRLRLVREITEDTRGVLATVTRDGVRRGIPPKEIARNLRGSLGLTEHQAQSVTNYRRLLESGDRTALQRALRDKRFDSSVRRAVRGERALTQSQMDRMVGRYESRMLDFRAKTIGNTESLASLHEGEQEMFDQAIEQRRLLPQQITKIWRTAMDERVRGSHHGMNGQQRQHDLPFRSGLGNSLMHPGDRNAPAKDVIKCRCVLERNVSGQRSGR